VAILTVLSMRYVASISLLDIMELIAIAIESQGVTFYTCIGPQPQCLLLNGEC